MEVLPRSRSRAFVMLVVVAASGWSAAGQSPLPEPNSQPNPYRTIENFAQLPDGRKWGTSSAIDIDPDGKSIWVAERCGANSCLGSDLPMIFKFDASGKVVKNFGAGEVVFPHGLHVDRQGNVWVVDGQTNQTTGRRGQPPAPMPANKVGMQVIKFSPDGKVLLRLGTAGVAGTDEAHFNQPSDVVTNAKGEIFVADGHGGETNARVVKFSKDGAFVKTWGTRGNGPGQFDTPHSLAIDSKDRIFVADRFNSRIQIFDGEGTLLAEMKQFSRPSGIYIDRNDIIYSADSESNKARGHDEYTRGIRVGSVRDGRVTAFIADPNGNQENPPLAATSGAEGVVADAQGNIYAVQVAPAALMKYVKK